MLFFDWYRISFESNMKHSMRTQWHGNAILTHFKFEFMTIYVITKMWFKKKGLKPKSLLKNMEGSFIVWINLLTGISNENYLLFSSNHWSIPMGKLVSTCIWHGFRFSSVRVVIRNRVFNFLRFEFIFCVTR